MGIETILVVGIVIIAVGIVFGLGRAKRKATRANEARSSGNASAARR